MDDVSDPVVELVVAPPAPPAPVPSSHAASCATLTARPRDTATAARRMDRDSPGAWGASGASQ